MLTFGIVSEGIHDQIIIETVLVGYFDDPDIELFSMQPTRDETDLQKQGSPGGWTRVLEYLQTDDFRDWFDKVDYVIIQIDTDVCDQVGFDVPKFNGSTRIEESILINNVIEKLVEKIGEFYKHHKEKIIFAICVDSIECWLLSLYYDDDKRKKLHNCIETLNRAINTKLEFTIDPNKKYGQSSRYSDVSKPYRKRKTLMENISHNKSFETFINNLDTQVKLDDEKKDNNNSVENV